MLKKINSEYVLRRIFSVLSVLSEKKILKISSVNKYLSQKLYIDILKIKKVAPNYVTKEENGIFKIKSLQNDFLSYEGGYVNGRKHGYGKEYKLEKV